MQQEEALYLQGGEQLYYLKMGAGKKILLAFHGYGNNAALFTPFEKYLSADYTILSFNLPYHGGHVWNGAELSINDLEVLLQHIQQQYLVDKVSLIGYSLGGRICLTITEHFPCMIEKVVLLSSDGMTFNPFYLFTTRTFLGKKMFLHLVDNPGMYLAILAVLKWLKLIREALYVFICNHLKTKADREFLLNVWCTTSAMRPHRNRLKMEVEKHDIPIWVYAGKSDSIIPVKHARRFVKKIKTAQMVILKCGHRTINVDTVPVICQSLLS